MTVVLICVLNTQFVQNIVSYLNKTGLSTSFGVLLLTALCNPSTYVLAEGEDEEVSNLHLIGFSCLGVGLTLFFLIGLVCLFYYQRNRIGHYNFSVKPKQENFTYLVFNT